MMLLPGCSCCSGGGGETELCRLPHICSYALRVKSPSAIAAGPSWAGCDGSQAFMLQEHLNHPFSASGKFGWLDTLPKGECPAFDSYFDGEGGKAAVTTLLTANDATLVGNYVQPSVGASVTFSETLYRCSGERFDMVGIYIDLSVSVFGEANFLELNINDDWWYVSAVANASVSVSCSDPTSILSSNDFVVTTRAGSGPRAFDGFLPYQCIAGKHGNCEIPENKTLITAHPQTPLSIAMSLESISLGPWTYASEWNLNFGGTACDTVLQDAVDHLNQISVEFELVSRDSCNPAP